MDQQPGPWDLVDTDEATTLYKEEHSLREIPPVGRAGEGRTVASCEVLIDIEGHCMLK
jgi:hypothetical protein